MKTYVKNSSVHGRGLFAADYFKKGEIIQKAHVVVFPNKDKDLIDIVMTSVLSPYLICWGKKGSLTALAFSDFSFCNHSLNPNADYIKNFRNKTITLKARRDISKDEEILINYNGDPEDDTPWKF